MSEQMYSPLNGFGVVVGFIFYVCMDYCRGEVIFSGSGGKSYLCYRWPSARVALGTDPFLLG